MLEAKPHLDLLDRVLREDHTRIPLYGTFSLTKSAPEECIALLLRQTSLERQVQSQLGLERYLKYVTQYLGRDRSLSDLAMPRHYPTRVLSGIGAPCSGSNIFLFFPQALGLDSSELGTIGLEFVDVWEQYFAQCIFPVVRHLFDSTTQIAMFDLLGGRVAEVAYTASLFHEIGHRVGPLRVSPDPDPRQKLDKFNLDVLGELTTDSLCVSILNDRLDVAVFVTLFRMLWSARRGFIDSPKSGMLNEDNDAWTGAYLWERLVAEKALERQDGKLSLTVERLPQIWKQVADEVFALGAKIVAEEPAQQNATAREWLNANVPRDRASGRFVYPEQMRSALSECVYFPEKPSTLPLLVMPRELLSQHVHEHVTRLTTEHNLTGDEARTLDHAGVKLRHVPKWLK